MVIQRLPPAIRVVVDAQQRGSVWEAAAKIFDAYDLVGDALQPFPPVKHPSRLVAETQAFMDFREWANRRWPRRTIPDPVRGI